MTCRCHRGLLYAGLTTCPGCGHCSLDAMDGWEGCERRACGYERTLDTAAQQEHAARQAVRPLSNAVRVIRPVNDDKAPGVARDGSRGLSSTTRGST